MQLLHSRNAWYYREGPEPTVDFCLWVLQVDGLRVPPFDQHPDGDGSLRALGLTAADWQTWFLRVLDPAQREQDVEQLQQLLLAEYLRITNMDRDQLKRRHQADALKISTDPPLPPPPPFYPHQASWHGGDAIKQRLIELEAHYQQMESQREKESEALERSLLWQERKMRPRLYDELKPYHHHLPPLNIYLAAYAFPLDYLVTPATLLMTVQAGQPDPREYRERVLAAAAELAAHPKRRKQPSAYLAYTRNEVGSGQFVAYRSYERKLTPPPPPPKPEPPRFDDPLKQMVVEELRDERTFEIDLSTIQFLREKQRPGWRLYEVTFQEADGEPQRMVVILEQSDDNSWRCNGGGSSADMQQRWSELVAPVHDHPLLFLNTQWFSFEHQQYLQSAHGHVIDNGFHVERVRLVNKAGQALEDTVEDGYVFFACTPKELVQLPMQAELYDHLGKLVWQQKIPDQGLPPWLKVRYQH